MASEMTSRGLRALSDPTRLHIIEFLSAQCGHKAEVDEEGSVYSPTAGEVCCHLTGLERINSTVSHHLHELRAADLVRLEKRGKHTVCSLVPATLETIAQELVALAKGANKDGCC